MDHHRVSRRTKILSNHLHPSPSTTTATTLSLTPCLNYSPPELSNPFAFDVREMRKLMDGHNLEDRDWIFNLIIQSDLFNRRQQGGRVFVSPDFNQTMEQQRDITMNRIAYLKDHGVFKGWLTDDGPESELRKLALHEVIGMYDHSLAIKIGVHIFLWGGAVKFLGTKRHHDKWLRSTENYEMKGCFAMTELGHGSNVRGIETITTYDSNTGEFVINTPCESAQKYWIGGAANHATHTIVFSQLNINGSNQGVHAFIAQIRDSEGNICPNIRIADCGHKIGLNGVDNGRIWFDNVRIPKENLLNSVADVSPAGEYLSAIKNAEQRFGAFLAPLTSGRVTIAANAVYISKISIAIAIRYALTRRAFSITPNGPEVLLLDYPSHQRRLLPLLAKIYALSFAANELKMMYVKRTPESNKAIHIVSSAYKAITTWNNMRTLQECREACGGQGLKTENRIGHFKGEFDVQLTFEGDNNVLMQQISKALLAEYIACETRNKPFKGLGLEHMNKPLPVIPSQLTSSTVRSSEFQIDLFHLRERDLLRRFAAEVSQYQAQGESKESASIQSYQLAEDLGRAFSERSILKTFLEAESNVPAGALKDVLGLLRSMYALISVDEDAAFLRYGYLSTENAAAVRKEVPTLSAEIRPHALALVSSFGIKAVHYCTASSVMVGYTLTPARYNQGDNQTESDLMKPPPGYPDSSIKLHAHEANAFSSKRKDTFGSNVLFYDRQYIALNEADVLAVRTCREIEGPYIDYLEQQFKKPVLPSGPVILEPPTKSLEESWVTWLGGFKPDSVIYCCFESECKLKSNQFQDLLLGLELTGMPFLAALKPPFGFESVEEALPEGFEERVQGRGVVHGGWVIQQLILEHPSVGCFITHCGSGSLSEALVNKCQLVLLPNVGDQIFNARMMGNNLQVGVEVVKGEDGFYTKGSVCEAVSIVMDAENETGKKVRDNHTKIREMLLKKDLESYYIDDFCKKFQEIVQ